MKTNIQNQDSRLQSRPEQVSTGRNTKGQLPKLDFKLRHRNRQLPAENVLELLQSEAPEFRKIAHVVGQWVWIQFRQKQPQRVTSALIATQQVNRSSKVTTTDVLRVALRRIKDQEAIDAEEIKTLRAKDGRSAKGKAVRQS